MTSKSKEEVSEDVKHCAIIEDEKKSAMPTDVLVFEKTGPIVQLDTITFLLDGLDTPILELRKNGDIFVKGKLIENDKQVIDALKQFLKIY